MTSRYNKCYEGNATDENEMDGAGSTHHENENYIKIVVGRPEADRLEDLAIDGRLITFAEGILCSA
jgi:hypothetical protein